MSKSNRKPSLLFVFADQLRGTDLGCTGNPDVISPHLDQFAHEGIQLERAFANSPVCGPSRACMLTGRMPHHTGVVGNDLPLDDGLATFGTLAQAERHKTGYIGKWHLDGLSRDKFTPPGPRRFGFDYWAAFNCSHAYFETKYYRDTPNLVEEDGYEPEIQTRLACEFLDGVSSDEAFTLFLSWGPPHDPYLQVPDSYRSLYDPQKISLRENAVPDSSNPLAQGKDCHETTAAYYAAITALDDCFGRLMAHLKRLGRDQDTLVVFTSDHGDMLWSHGLLKKQLPYEESISVPVLARWPEVLPAGVVSPGLFGIADFLPTISSLLGWNCQAPFEGHDCSAMWKDALASSPNQAVYLANYASYDESAQQGIAPWRGIRTDRYTYVEQANRKPWLLFDNEADPLQLDNLAGSSAAQPLRSELMAQLSAALEKAGDPFLDQPDIMRHLGLEGEWEQRNIDLDAYWKSKRPPKVQTPESVAS